MAKVAIQGGVKNYLGNQKTVSGIPIKWQSGPDAPDTELAYITKAEKNLLLKKDLHGSLKNGPNTGPKGIMSLDSQGDRGTYGDTGQSYGDRQTSDKSPEVGDKGGGYQEDFYALVEDITKLTTTLGQLEQRKDHGRAAAEYRERYSEHFKAKQRLDYMNRFMIKWRNQRDQLFERRDMDDDVKRAVLRTMIDQRDDMLVQMLDIMADVRGGGEIFKEALFDD